MKWMAAAAAALACVVPTAVHAVGKASDVSWGKANVSLARYDRDALECANRSYGVAVAMQPRTVNALAVQNDASFYSLFTGSLFDTNRPGESLASMAVLPDHVMLRSTDYQDLFDHAAWVDVVEQLQVVVDRCLTDRGYTRFQLNPRQRIALHRLRVGSPERERYLHRLGSDPAVLESQRL